MHIVTTENFCEATASLWLGDALEFLKSLSDNSVDLLLTSPPYFVGKEYDRSRSLADFKAELARVMPEIARTLKPGGSLCWQVGNHVERSRVTPLDTAVYPIVDQFPEFILRNRIVWTFGHGVHTSNRFSGRHETILWYTKGDGYFFDLDPVRIPQKYPGKRYYKGPKKGEWSGNPLGKNPGDVWDIPNVKSKHPEKTEHPCQFPTALAGRLVQALCPPGGLVVDPYMGAASTGVSALMHGRSFAGSDLEPRYLRVATKRVRDFVAGVAKIREDKPVRQPKGDEAVAMLPDHFLLARGG